MKIRETADIAVRYIREHEGERICISLRSDPYEDFLCEKHCRGLDEFCVKRMLKHYKQDNHDKH